MRTNQIKRIEQEKGKPLKQVLLDMYPDHPSQTGLAKALKVSQGTVAGWLMRYRLKEVKRLVDESEVTS